MASVSLVHGAARTAGCLVPAARPAPASSDRRRRIDRASAAPDSPTTAPALPGLWWALLAHPKHPLTTCKALHSRSSISPARKRHEARLRPPPLARRRRLRCCLDARVHAAAAGCSPRGGAARSRRPAGHLCLDRGDRPAAAGAGDCGAAPGAVRPAAAPHPGRRPAARVRGAAQPAAGRGGGRRPHPLHRHQRAGGLVRRGGTRAESASQPWAWRPQAVGA